ncbi:MAG: hypothetical protein DWI00_14100 [Planctomycetota bacterium]|nr:MAG: hypothetical protein DWI00_14100 [Planctomycetota bacterium]
MHRLLLALLAIMGPAAFADETQCDTEFSITVVDHLRRPVANAVVLAPTNTKDELKIFRTNADGVTKLPSLTTNSCSLEVSAEGFRETLWKGKPNAAVTIVMLPIIAGRVLDDKERPMSDAFLTSEPVVFAKTGLPEFPIRTVSDAGQNWSKRGGEFRLQSPHFASILHQSNPESLMPLFVFERTYRFGSFRSLPLSGLDKPVELKLQPLVHVQATYTFNSEKPPRSFRWIITDKEQRTLAEIRATIETNIYATLATLNCRLPAGEYELHCVDMIPEHEPVVIPVKLSGEPGSVKLEEQDVEPRIISDSNVNMIVDENLEAPVFSVDDIEVPEGNWGTIYGRIIADQATLQHRPVVAVKSNPAKGISQDVFAEDLKVNQKTGGVDNVFIWMPKRPEKIHPDLIEPPIEPVWFAQWGLRFVPHVIVAKAGQTIAVANADAVAGNMHTFPLKSQPINWLLAPGTIGARAKRMTLNKAESLPFKVTDDLHPWMSAYWLVVDHPYATKTNSEGDFVIPNLPPGEHEFRVWHERKGYIHRKLLIRVEAGKVTKVDFEPVSLALP